jgi:hypothetical protein
VAQDVCGHPAAMITNREGTTERSKVSVLRPPLAYTAAQAAAIIGGSCKATWLKSQARSGKIPYLWIGGAYNFSETHLLEIMSIVEVRPKAQPDAQPAPTAPRPPLTAALRVLEAPKLVSRQPRDLHGRRARHNDPGVT